jgi:endonuclease YncB( thermonuclease family)
MEDLVSLLATTNFDVKAVTAYRPDIHYGKVIKVYDGDTITIVTQLHNGDLVPTKGLYKFNVRILGIDAPELKTNSTAEHDLGIKARDALSALLMNKVVRLSNISYDQYGRILCNVFLDKLNIAEWTLSKNYTVAYDGGTKVKKWG